MKKKVYNVYDYGCLEETWGFTSLPSRLYEKIFVTVSGCNDGKIRGVNAGGWLLLEPWITPRFFENLDAADGNQVVMDYSSKAQEVF